MALILLRTKWNNEAFKGMVASPTNRRKATEEAFQTIGWKLRHIYLCIASETWHILAEGDPSKMIQAEILCRASGGYDSAEAEIVVTPEEFFDAASEMSQKIAEFDAPNRDEIDRMLLDE